jgi:enoyl-CoA hydratase
MGFDRTDDGPLAVLTLDHGDLNLFDASVFDSFVAEVDALAQDPPRALLLRAEGRVVSAGVDVHEFEGLSPRDAAVL